MGIKGLLPFLKDVQTPTNIKTFKGCTVAVDTYCWLHKGVYGCVEQIAYDKDDGQYVAYCMKYVHLLVAWGLRPILVFDGRNLPAKEQTEKERRERRQSYRNKALTFLHEGKQAEARRCLERCIDITPAMAARVMEAARSEGIDCIVAPYEADAQLAYLNRRGIAQLVISEDSDLLLFGCERVFFKLDVNGNGILIEQDSLCRLKVFKNHYTFDKFVAMCVLSGCDYLPSLPGIGLAKACKFVCATHQEDVSKALKRLPMCLNMLNLEVTDQYINQFRNACNTFRHQLVFDPITRKVVPLTDYPPGLDPTSLACAGEYIPDDKALQLALGNISSKDGSRLANYTPECYSRRDRLRRSYSSPSLAAASPQLQLSMWDHRFSVGGGSHGSAVRALPPPADSRSACGGSMPGTPTKSTTPSTDKSAERCSAHGTRVRLPPTSVAEAEWTVKELLSLYSDSHCVEQHVKPGVKHDVDCEEPELELQSSGGSSRAGGASMAPSSAAAATTAVTSSCASFPSLPTIPAREVGCADKDMALVDSSVNERTPDSLGVDLADCGGDRSRASLPAAAHEQGGSQPPLRRTNVFASSYKKERFHLDGVEHQLGATAAAPAGKPLHIVTKSRYFAGSTNSPHGTSAAQLCRGGSGLLDAMKEIDPVNNKNDLSSSQYKDQLSPVTASIPSSATLSDLGSRAIEPAPGVAQGGRAEARCAVAATAHCQPRLQCFSWRPNGLHSGRDNSLPLQSPPQAAGARATLQAGDHAVTRLRTPGLVATAAKSAAKTALSSKLTPTKRPAQSSQQPATGTLLAYLRTAVNSESSASSSSRRPKHHSGMPQSLSPASLRLSEGCGRPSGADKGESRADAVQRLSSGTVNDAEALPASVRHQHVLPSARASPEAAAAVSCNSGKRKATLDGDDDCRVCTETLVGRRGSATKQTRAVLSDLSHDGNHCTPDRSGPLSSQLFKFKYQSRSCPAKMQVPSSTAK